MYLQFYYNQFIVNSHKNSSEKDNLKIVLRLAASYQQIIQMNSNKQRTRIRIELKNVVASKQAHFFVLVQMKQPNSNKSVKFRTETSCLTNRPKYQKNIFTFTIDNNPQTFKFGLMMAKSQLDSDATTAMVFGVCSLPFSKSRLLEQKGQVYQSTLLLVDRSKEVGKFIVNISLNDKQYKLNESGVIFDPLISRVLYNQQCTDKLRLETSIKLLEQKLEKLYEQYSSSKKEQYFFQKLYYDLEQDEKQLKNEIDNLQKINSKIQHKLDSLENIENLKIQIDMFSQTEQGKKVLISRLEYFQDRIYREIEENEKLAIEYKRIRPQIQANLKKAEEHADKIKGKRLQQFQIQNNQKILSSYEDLLYQFQINEQTIKSLSKMSEKSELTAQQAKLLLSQVSYEIKLTELGSDKDKKVKQNRWLKEIEKEIIESNKKQQKLSQEEQMVYKIKLSALQRQIQQVRKKLYKISDI